jgi:hypothetical protein
MGSSESKVSEKILVQKNKLLDNSLWQKKLIIAP